MLSDIFQDIYVMKSQIAKGLSTDWLLGSLSTSVESSPALMKIEAGGLLHAVFPLSYQLKEMPVYLFLYTKQGSGKIADSDGTTFLNADTVLLYDCRKPFKVSISSSGWDFVILFLSGDIVDSYLSCLNRKGIVHKMSPSSDIPSYLEHILAMKTIDTVSKALCVHKWMTDILTELCVTSLNQNNKDEHLPDYMIAMKEMMDDSYATNYSLSDFEEHFGISKYRLCREFSQYFQASPLQYLNRRRIEASKDLLLSTNLTIHEIGSSVGIDNTNHYINLFKKFTGTTPLSYKQGAPASIRALHCPYEPDVLPQ